MSNTNMFSKNLYKNNVVNKRNITKKLDFQAFLFYNTKAN